MTASAFATSYHTTSHHHATRGFSLVEISIVLVVVATMLAGVLPYITESTKIRDVDTTADRMKTIEEALQAYFGANQELPCPSDITLAISSANFGVQAANNSCTGGTPAANWSSGGNIVGGGVPTKTLGLPDEYAFDGWGRRFYYHVDPDATVSTTFNSASTGTITINDGSGAARTAAAVYALVSAGRNGYGAYTRSGTVRLNNGSTNTDERENCQTTGTVCSGTAAAYNTTLVQKMEQASNPTDPLTNFDDIVAYKLRGNMLTGGGGDTLWTAAGANIYNTNLAGNVGVGTTNPTNALHVYSTVGAKGISLDGTTDPGIQFYTSGVNRGAIGMPTTAGNWAGGSAIGDVVMRTSGGKLLFDTNNGIGTPAISVLGANGNVGIGTTAPLARLEVSGGINLTGATSGASYGVALSTTTQNFDYTNASGTYKVNHYGMTVAPFPGSAATYLSGYGELALFTLGANRLHITNGGNVGIGTAAPAYKLDVNGTARINGVVHPVSDIRLKEKIEPVTHALAAVKKMRGVSYEWKDKSNGRDGRDLGLIAQEVEKIVPDLVRTANDKQHMKSMNYDGFTALFVEAFKELDAKIEALPADHSVVAPPKATTPPMAPPLPRWVIVGLIAPWFGILVLALKLRRR